MSNKNPQDEYNKSRALNDRVGDKYGRDSDINHSDQGKYAREQRRSASGDTKGCFTGNTRVLTSSGWVQMADIRENDFAITVDTRTQNISVQKVRRVKVSKSTIRIWNINTSQQSNPIRTTFSHQFRVSSKWLPTWRLRQGQFFYSLDEKRNWSKNEILDIEKTSDFERVYNLVTEQNCTYVVEGAVVNCFGYAINIRTLLTRLLSSEILDNRLQSIG